MQGRGAWIPEGPLEGYSEAICSTRWAWDPRTCAAGIELRGVEAQLSLGKSTAGFLYAGPLFIHQLSHAWIDFSGIRMTTCASAASTTSRTASARLSPSSSTRSAIEAVQGVWRILLGHHRERGPARRPAASTASSAASTTTSWGIPYGPDDGTIAPWAAVASLPFAPEIVLRRSADPRNLPEMRQVRLLCSLNPTFTDPSSSGEGWRSQGYYGIEQGPIVRMIETTIRVSLELMKRCQYLVTAGARWVCPFRQYRRIVRSRGAGSVETCGLTGASSVGLATI